MVGLSPPMIFPVNTHSNKGPTMEQTAPEWFDGKKLGVDFIDQDHAQIASMMDFLVIRLAGPSTDEGINAVLSELADFTRVHFEREEDVMKQTDYPDREEHAAVHRGLIRVLSELIARVRREGHSKLSGSEVQSLRNWVTGHIKMEDRKLAEYLAQRSNFAVLVID
ncbi:bacteriohemerythrin [Paramagnetospirillum magneticum]|uniref:bacteriohemerythrin n=1 Tax=Paramagnetospirillum magneticum TaxID=84159 RepID=UPI0011D10DAF|nr:hemerythrin family protein [Paramagnetospirillum magneticum]